MYIQILVPRPDWHAADMPPIPPLAENELDIPELKKMIDFFHETANELLQQDQDRYAARHLSKSSSNKFMSEIMASGTLEDKVSAQTLAVQESPVHTIKTFESLLNLAGKKSRNQALMALGALKDLLAQGVVLPPDRKLRAFGKQPGLLAYIRQNVKNDMHLSVLKASIPRECLVVWAYEDWLKRTYFELLKILERWCNDEVEYARIQAVTFVWELLKEKPEQEENLLRLLVNKLGDTANKVASRASYLLLQLQTSHPAMKSIVIGAIESDALFRPGQSLHAKYYAIITLNQTVLSSPEKDVANKLLDVYFGLFLSLLKQDKSDDSEPVKKTQGGGGRAGRKARQKARLQESARQAEDQLNERLISQILTGVNRAFPFADPEDKKLESRMDTIFRFTHSANFNTAVQALILIQQISNSKQYAAERYYRTLYESLLDPRLITSSKQILYLNLLYRSLKTDVSIKRTVAFVKRLLQIITLHEPPFVCGVLYLISELQKSTPSIRTMISEPELSPTEAYETFHDVDDEASSPPKANGRTAQAATSDSQAYDPRKRDPLHANASGTCLWDMLPLTQHYHPTISLYASRLLSGETLAEGTPDPTLHSLTHFLDRFAYRSPRAKDAKMRGSSIMQPLAGAPTVDLLVRESGKGRAEQPLNVEGFWASKGDQVREDEVFFHRYFEEAGRSKNRVQKRAEKRKRRNGVGDVDDGLGGEGGGEEEGTDEEGEKEIWRALVRSRPEVEGVGEDGDEDGFEEEDLKDLMGSGDEDGAEGDGEVEFRDAPDSQEEAEGDGAVGGADEGSGDEFDAAELEDGEDAFVGSDEELPSDVEAVLEGKKGKEKKQEDKGGNNQKQRRKLKSLPIFASAEEYAQFLGDDEEE